MYRAQSRRGILALAALLPAVALIFGSLVTGSRPALADGVAPAVVIDALSQSLAGLNLPVAGLAPR